MTPLEIFPALLEACPTARARWEEELEWWGDEDAGNYNRIVVFAHHIVESYAAGSTAEFPAFFGVLERMVGSDDGYVRELGTIGLIEDIQRIASHSVGYAVFEPWLGFATKLAWANVEATWSGASSLAEVLRRELRVKKR